METASNDLALEVTTVRFINAVASTASTRAHSRRFRAETGIDLSPADVRFLELLSGRPPVPTSVLARELGISLAQASRQAKQMEIDGYAERSTDPADRRRTLVSLTASTAAILDTWLLAWSRDYLAPLQGWSAPQVAACADWFALAHARLAEALPDRPRSGAADRWAELAGADYDPETSFFISTVIRIVTWVGQSRGFNDLLEVVNSPVRPHALAALQVLQHSGPLSIAGIAERLAIDPSQASKRLSQLTALKLVDRAVDGFDRRSSLIRLSRKGAALLDKIADAQLAGFEELTADITADDRQRWTPLVKAYVDGLLHHWVNPDGSVSSGDTARPR